MCRLIVCEKCKLYTWTGCGRHVTEIMKDVHESDKCKCKPLPKAKEDVKGDCIIM